jgi:hypothetical protein
MEKDVKQQPNQPNNDFVLNKKQKCLKLNTLNNNKEEEENKKREESWSYFLENMDFTSPLASKIIGVQPKYQFNQYFLLK